MSVTSLLFMCEVVHAVLYGDYKFYKNFGQVFYDYSQQEYHAVNGEVMEVDSKDVIATDRGIFFDSIGARVVNLHSGSWPLPSNFFWDWQFSAWLYPLSSSSSVFLERSCPMGEQQAVTWENDAVTFNIQECSSGSCTPNSASISVTGGSYFSGANGWFFMTGTIDSNTPTFILTINDDFTDSNAYSIGSTYSVSSECKTVLGSAFKGFIYSLVLGDLSENFSSLLVTDGSACVGVCEAGSGSYCSCTDCVSLPSTYCVSSCNDPNMFWDCSSSYTCNGLETAVTACVECSLPSLSCEADGTDLTEIICGFGCLTCSSLDSCECKFAYSDATCQCPDSSAGHNEECTCVAGYAMTAQADGSYACVACEDPCTSCEGNPEYCTACSNGNTPTAGNCCESGYSWNGSECECPAGSGLVEGQCVVCNSNEYVALNGSCTVCPEGCSKCESHDLCTECGANAETAGWICACLAGYTSQGSSCVSLNITVTAELIDTSRVRLSFSENPGDAFTEAHITLEIEDDPNFRWKLKTNNSTEAFIHLTFKEDIHRGQRLYISIKAETNGRRLSTFSEDSIELTLNSYKYIEDSVVSDTVSQSIGLIAAGIYATSFSSMDFTSMWSLLNTLEVIQYIALTNNPLTPGLYAMLGAVGHVNSMINLFKLFLDDSGLQPYDLAYNFGYTTNDFVLNSGKFLSLLGILTVAGLLLLFIGSLGLYKRFSWFQSLCKPFNYDAYTRFFIQAYFTFGICAILQVFEVSDYLGQLRVFARNPWLLLCCICSRIWCVPTIYSWIVHDVSSTHYPY